MPAAPPTGDRAGSRSEPREETSRAERVSAREARRREHTAPAPAATLSFLLLLALALLAPVATARAQLPDPASDATDPEAQARREEEERRRLTTNLHLGELRLSLGGHVEGGRAPFGARGGFHLAGGLDVLRNEVLGASLRALTADVAWSQGAGAFFVAATLARVDHWMFGAAGGGVCAAPGLTVVPATTCDAESGYVGVGGTLLSYQHDTSDSRNVLRIVEGYVALSPLPAFQSAWAERRFPLLVGASLDYLWGVTGDPSARSELWVGRAAFAIDGVFRLLGFRMGIDARVAYRPSFTDWGGDWGLEATARVLYLDVHRLFRTQGTLYRIVLEVGYAHWSEPARAMGVPWAGVASDTGVLRVGLEPVVWNVP